MLNFDWLRQQYPHEDLQRSFDILQKYIEENPDKYELCVSELAKTNNLNWVDIGRMCVAVVCMSEAGFVRESFGVIDENRIALSQRWNEMEDIPEEYSKMNLRTFYVICERENANKK